MSKIDNCRVSVVMCTYNGAKYLRPQLDSILQQSHAVTELIVQDDQSTDETFAILQEYAARYSQMHVSVRQERTGLNDNFFTAMDRATGDYIAISDQDDIWALDKIERQLEVMGDNWLCFHPSPNFPNDDLSRLASVDSRPANATVPRLLYCGAVLGHTILMRTDFYHRLRASIPADEMNYLIGSMCYDSILAIGATIYQKVAYINLPLTYHRRLTASVSNSVVKRDITKRSIGNFVRQVWRNVNPVRRHRLRPVVDRRLECISRLVKLFPTADTIRYQEYIDAFRAHTWCKDVQFVAKSVTLRRELFFTPQDKESVLILRALFFIVTIYEAFDLYYAYQQHGRPDMK